MPRVRNNQVADFLSAFGQTYGLARQVASDRALSEAMDAQPEQSTQFTSDQGDALNQAAGDGANVTWNVDRRAYAIDPAIGQGGAMWVPEVAPKTQTTFLGRQYDGTLSPELMTTARYNAAADAVGRFNPERGLQLRGRAQDLDLSQRRFGMELDRHQRDGIRFGWAAREETRNARKADEADASDALLRQSLAEYTGAPEQITPTARYLNKSPSRVSMGKPDKDGFMQIAVINEEGDDTEFLRLPPQQQATLYAAGKLLTVDPQRALTLMAGVNKSLAEAVAQENGLTFKVADATNSAADRISGRAIQRLNADTQRFSAESADQARKDQAALARERADKGPDDAARMYGEARRLELDLRKNGAQEPEVRDQVAKFLLGQGLPTPNAMAVLRSGKGTSGAPLSAKDLDDWDATYPGMPVQAVLGTRPQLRTAPPPKRSALPARIIAPRQQHAEPDNPAGVALDEAREALAELRRTAPGLRSGRAAIDAHAVRMDEARAKLRDAEAAYANTLPDRSSVPYLGLQGVAIGNR